MILLLTVVSSSNCIGAVPVRRRQDAAALFAKDSLSREDSVLSTQILQSRRRYGLLTSGERRGAAS